MQRYNEYHRSLDAELHDLKNRIRNLVPHWQTDGEFKESLLRSVLRNHLPSSLLIGRGFVVTDQTASTQIDILIVDANSPTLFRDGDLMIVTPDCVRAAIEVKTSLSTVKEIHDCSKKLLKLLSLCEKTNQSCSPWLGIFCYEARLQSADHILRGLKTSADGFGGCVNCMAYGTDLIGRLCDGYEYSENVTYRDVQRCGWRLFRFEGLALSYFIGHLISWLNLLTQNKHSGVWFPLRGKEFLHCIYEIDDVYDLDCDPPQRDVH